MDIGMEPVMDMQAEVDPSVDMWSDLSDGPGDAVPSTPSGKPEPAEESAGTVSDDERMPASGSELEPQFW
eukprot:5411853-Karenia_brevis.AAC.1